MQTIIKITKKYTNNMRNIMTVISKYLIAYISTVLMYF